MTCQPPLGPHAAMHDAALALYRQRAPLYDWELAPFEPIREHALQRLQLRPGETVLDLGCGTGLSLPRLRQAVSPGGRVIGIEQCPEMLAKAGARVTDNAPGLAPVQLLCTPVEEAVIEGWADAALFHFTHDILQDAQALATVMRHLRPGARIVATGIQWAPAWAWMANLWVWSAACYSVRNMQHLDAPWQLLSAVLPGLRVESMWQGAVFIAHGQVPQAH